MHERISLQVEISAHTDSTGSHEYNYDLSRKRAGSVVEYLNNHGIEKSRLQAKGFGETIPVAGNATEEGRQQNRRVEFQILRVETTAER
jgi:outer membrane protein OmpA-like peptidoglycan-associated protein